MERSCAQCPTATSRHPPVRKPPYLRRDTYTHPSVDTSSSQLRDYLGNIEKAGKGCQNLLSASPPQYQDSSCDPLPGTTNPASTQVVNRIIKELSYAANVVDHFTTLHTMQGQLFVVEGSELPALAANLQLPRPATQRVPRVPASRRHEPTIIACAGRALAARQRPRRKRDRASPRTITDDRWPLRHPVVNFSVVRAAQEGSTGRVGLSRNAVMIESAHLDLPRTAWPVNGNDTT